MPDGFKRPYIHAYILKQTGLLSMHGLLYPSNIKGFKYVSTVWLKG